MSTYLLVHGGFAGGWVYDAVAGHLRAAGHEVIAPDLPRSGPAADAPRRYAAHVVDLLDRAPEPVILAGHSSGGITASQAAELRPQRVSLLVFVTAFALADGQRLADLGLPPFAVPDNGHIRVDAQAARQALFGDCTQADHQTAIARFQPEPLSVATCPVMLTAEGYGSVPKAYIECLRDQALPIDLQRTMQRDAGCSTVLSLDCGHMPQYAAPEALADHLVRLAT
jgi:pimeloyl-ACP methyl ester carboxylesterase